jgi:hypothetical protein
MSRTARLFLISAAILCGGFVAALGGAFSHGVEPDDYGRSTTLFWLVAGAVVALPLSVTAIIPSRFMSTGRWVRRASAVLLLFPTYLFSTIVTHNVRRALSGIGATPSALLIGIALTAACLCGVFTLLWPDIRRLWGAPSNPNSSGRESATADTRRST